MHKLPPRKHPHGCLRGNWRGESSAEQLAEYAASYAAQGVIVADPAHLTDAEMIALNLMPQRVEPLAHFTPPGL